VNACECMSDCFRQAGETRSRHHVAHNVCEYVCVCVSGALEIGQLRLGLMALGPAQAEKSPGAQTHTQMCTCTHTHTHTHTPPC